MTYIQAINIKSIYFLIFLIFLISCQKVDPNTGEKILIEPDPNKKAREFADKGGGLFGDINNKKSSTTF